MSPITDELSRLLQRAATHRQSRREFLGRASALGIGSLAANTMLASAVEAAGPVRGGHLKLGIQGGASTDSLDPALAASQGPYQVVRHIGDTLLTISETGDLEFRLAEEVSSSDDLATWAFRVRKGVEFHDGRTMTPDDVLMTIARHREESTASGALSVVGTIKSMRVDGDLFIAELESPNPDFPYLISDYHLIVQPGGGVDDPAAGIGTGPYRLVANEPGVRHAFERFANHWDPSIGHFDSTEVLIINNPTARLAALQAGEVHMVNRVPPTQAGRLRNVGGVVVESASGGGHYVFLMHCDTPPFDNEDLRLSLKYAVDREEMVEKILYGGGSVGNDHPINQAYPLFDDTIPQRRFDPDLAAEHYRRSGHSGPLVLRFADGAFPGADVAAQLFQQSAAKCGITIELLRVPDDGYWSEVWNVQPFIASYWGSYPTQDQMYSVAYAAGASWNDTRFSDARFDELLLAARVEGDTGRRKALYREMAMIVRDKGGLINMMFSDFIDARSDRILGWRPNPRGEMMAGFAAAKCWMA